MTTISKKEVHKFLDKHPDIPFSAAKFEYSLYLEPEAVEYANIRNEYLKSMLCLVIGFRGDVEMIPFLMKETERLERMYPQETYAQGPILAIQELAVRFLS